ncbi:PREDICTED: DNA-directed RNA polymerase II subunit GRINL1A, isoforms 4/5-like, partial [Dipodomys ordii]|uniref:DNA-directed RNA polymerase II subunit GRINL1A, isoforms 4/5-like n=1 Tax=Dipodomys ordii TaxID=10020 RepID=A0A1S3GW49_DIPOR
MATPARAPESPPAADPAPAVGPAEEEADCPPPPRQPQVPQNVLAAPRLRAPSSRGLGAAEFDGAAGDVEAPGETFAQRVTLAPGGSPAAPRAPARPAAAQPSLARAPRRPRGDGARRAGGRVLRP